MNLEEEIAKFRAKKKGKLAESVTENANEDGTQPVETADGRVPNDDGKKIGTKEIHEAQEILSTDTSKARQTLKSVSYPMSSGGRCDIGESCQTLHLL